MGGGGGGGGRREVKSFPLNVIVSYNSHLKGIMICKELTVVIPCHTFLMTLCEVSLSHIKFPTLNCTE